MTLEQWERNVRDAEHRRDLKFLIESIMFMPSNTETFIRITQELLAEIKEIMSIYNAEQKK